MVTPVQKKYPAERGAAWPPGASMAESAAAAAWPTGGTSAWAALHAPPKINYPYHYHPNNLPP